MMIEQKSPEESIKSLSIREAYNTFLLEVDDSEGETVKKKARFGIKIHFDLYEWLEEAMTIKLKKGVVIMHGRKYALSSILTEIENRNVLIKKYLLKKTGRNQLITPRES